MTETRSEAIDRLVAGYDRDLAKYPELVPDVLTSEDFRTCLEQIVAKTGKIRFLKNPPTFRDRPFGSLFLRLYKWHGGGGDLTGRFIANEDCLWVGRINAGRGGREESGVGTADWVPTSFPTFDQFDATTMLVRGGSPAAERWKKALGVTS